MRRKIDWVLKLASLLPPPQARDKANEKMLDLFQDTWNCGRYIYNNERPLWTENEATFSSATQVLVDCNSPWQHRLSSSYT